MDAPKPQFGDVAKVTGEEWADGGPEAAQALRARMQEIRQQRFAAGKRCLGCGEGLSAFAVGDENR